MRMTISLRAIKSNNYCGSKSTIRVFKKTAKKWETVLSAKEEQNTPKQNKGVGPKKMKRDPNYRENEMKIQMLSRSLFNQIFKNTNQPKIERSKIAQYQQQLQLHGIKLGETPPLPDVSLTLPPLKGKNLIEHFQAIADEQTQPYRLLIDTLLHSKLPPMPKTWKKTEGWTRYDEDGAFTSVEYPEEDALIFDVEVCVREGGAPTIACAVSNRHWYSWTSKTIVSSRRSQRRQPTETSRTYQVEQMIPLEAEFNSNPKLVIGHNVSYDRARIQSQYRLNATPMRFLDTMSMHVCVSGITSFQRAMLKSLKGVDEMDGDITWSTLSSLNSLLEVFKLYCGENHKDAISKEARNIFVDGTLEDIQKDFQNLMTYCARDVVATYRVFEKLFPLFRERFSHSATLAGMLELGMAYLPVNSNWHRYINESDLIYEELNIEAKHLLAKRANQACRLMHNEAYKNDLWMWNEDWSTQELKLKKPKTKIVKKKKSKDSQKCKEEEVAADETEEQEYERMQKEFQLLMERKSDLPKRAPWLAGYPLWYRKLCKKPTTEDWQPGPTEIGTGMQIAPKLLSLCWEGYPLHFIREHGWGFLVPFNEEKDDNCDETKPKIPLDELVKKCPVIDTNKSASSNESDAAFLKLSKDVELELGRKDYYSKAKKDPTNGLYKGTGVWCNIELENSCWFFRLPHKNGVNNRVGNPLARDFLIKFSENVLAGDNVTAERVIKIARMMSYWRNNRDRIVNQMVVKREASEDADVSTEAAIIPLVVTCGTLTRRAMEPTWMTASNAQLERIGSELRSMVQAPAGYRFVGADVDSQELWIASVLGDANEAGIHGATPFGWMTLNGVKSNGTDMHSVTAKAVGISRDQAKILNYARIYGAGQVFATRLLKQFNPTISDGEAKSKAMKMFTLTKGRKWFYLRDEYLDELEQNGFTKYEAQKLAAKYGKKIEEMFLNGRWSGGTESAMFNCLEEIAGMTQPYTPFLECRLSRALEPCAGNEDQFLTTRINWVVQSGAVDFLHLMLVSMRWLMGDKVRFCLSFHDEVRYVVEEKYAYQAALALHITNLLTRSFCAMRIGLNDLPQSVAFFSSVEVDQVLRKEATMDCKTPSNPHGLSAGYGIPFGETLDIKAAIEKANGSDLSQWEWHRTASDENSKN